MLLPHGLPLQDRSVGETFPAARPAPTTGFVDEDGLPSRAGRAPARDPGGGTLDLQAPSPGIPGTRRACFPERSVAEPERMGRARQAPGRRLRQARGGRHREGHPGGGCQRLLENGLERLLGGAMVAELRRLQREKIRLAAGGAQKGSVPSMDRVVGKPNRQGRLAIAPRGVARTKSPSIGQGGTQPHRRKPPPGPAGIHRRPQEMAADREERRPSGETRGSDTVARKPDLRADGQSRLPPDAFHEIARRRQDDLSRPLRGNPCGHALPISEAR